MQNFLKECVDNNNIHLNNILDDNLQILLGIVHYFYDFFR